MPRFAYVAVDPSGQQATGVQQADTLAAARLTLAQQNLRVVELKPKTSWTQIEITPHRIKPTELMHLSRQLAAFLRAGIPILDAIRTLAEESDRSAVRRVLTEIGADLRGGATLSEAIDRHPRDFPEFYRGILQSAELTGRLDDVLDQLSQYLERDLEARRKIQSAMIYPAIVAAMSLVTILVLTVYVLPKFESFFASLHAELPLPTRMLLGIAGFLGHWWWLILAVLAAVAGGAVITVRTEGGRLAWHRLLLRVPVLGDTVRYALVERFTRILASMVNAGVPLPTAMTVATNSLRNLVFERALTAARSSMMQGAGLAQPISSTRLFPGVAAQMIRVGEDTGTLDAQLGVAAEFYERELDYKVKKLTTTIEPTVIVVMGLVVGFVAIALVSAMYGIFRSANLQ
ncbi:MAG TPA: type II secretion system F family protein [Kineosporiaceae bacterium]|nr:type II secretion system F family protein [Kineosporiaceae bacterium]